MKKQSPALRQALKIQRTLNELIYLLKSDEKQKVGKQKKIDDALREANLNKIGYVV